jgi:hypothetical protein
MEKHLKVNLRKSDIKEIMEIYKLIKYQNGRGAEENKICNRIIKQCKKAINK